MFWNNLKSSKKVSYEVSDNLGLTDSEKQGIEANKAFEDFVVKIESINQLLLRDEREAAFNVLKKNEKQTLYGVTLELPMPISTNFYALLDKFNSNKPHAIDIRPFEVEIPNKEIVENEEVEKVPVEENIQDEVNKEQIDDSKQKLRPFPDTIIAEKDAEIKRLRIQINQSSVGDKEEESEYNELSKSIIKSDNSDNVVAKEHINIFDNPPEEVEVYNEEQCSQCGFKKIKGAKFCSSCGNNLQNVEIPDSQKVPLPLEVLDKKVLEELPMEFSKLFSLKDGWNIRPKIEQEVALEFEMKRDDILKAVTESVEIKKNKAIELERKKYEEQEEKIKSEFEVKLKSETEAAITEMESDKAEEIEKRLDLRRQYLKHWYQNGLAQLEGKKLLK